MNDKQGLRMILASFLSGIIFSGLIFMTINGLRATQPLKSTIRISPITVAEKNENNLSPVNGKIQLNQATLSELTTLPGIGEAKANAIIEFREKYGAFEDISELSYVPGIGNTLLKSIQDLVIIN
jgi:competence protein ComEA